MRKHQSSFKIVKNLKKHIKYTRVVGFDLGTKNLAYCYMEANKTKIADFVVNPITTLTWPIYSKQFKIFYNEIKRLYVKYKPNIVVMERFQSRGLRGLSVECINVMIGIMTTLAFKLKIKFILITASQWKNDFQKTFDKNLKELYEHVKPLPPHFVDASLQAWFVYNANRLQPFSNWKLSKLNGIRKAWNLHLKVKNKKRKTYARSKTLLI